MVTDGHRISSLESSTSYVCKNISLESATLFLHRTLTAARGRAASFRTTTSQPNSICQPCHSRRISSRRTASETRWIHYAVPVHRALWHGSTIIKVDLDSSLPFVIQHRYAFLVFPSFVPPSVVNRRRKLNQRIDFSTDEVASS